jgi:hypothetical protein
MQCSESVTFWYGFGSAPHRITDLRIQILLFSLVTFKMPTEFFFSFKFTMFYLSHRCQRCHGKKVRKTANYHNLLFAIIVNQCLCVKYQT